MQCSHCAHCLNSIGFSQQFIDTEEINDDKINVTWYTVRVYVGSLIFHEYLYAYVGPLIFQEQEQEQEIEQE